MNKNILVTGGNGQLGSQIKELVTQFKEFKFTFLTRELLDLSDPESIDKYFIKNNFDVIINTAAYTAFDNAEEDVERAKAINTNAVKKLAEIAKENAIQLIHISTDYVFDGNNNKPYTENDEVNPQSIYGKTKADGEKAMLVENPMNSAIIRTSWLYSKYGNNFVKTMLRLGRERDEVGVVFDQVGTPTYAKDLALMILQGIRNSKYNTNDSELYHYSNEGVCSWYDFTKAIFELSEIKCDVKAIETKDFPAKGIRPHYSVLNKKRIKKKFGINIPHWRDSLNECLVNMKI